MKRILLLGAGLSASTLIKYLLEQAVEQNWELRVVDQSLEMVQSKLAGASGIALDAAGRLYIADTNNNRVRRVRADGVQSMPPDQLRPALRPPKDWKS